MEGFLLFGCGCWAADLESWQSESERKVVGIWPADMISCFDNEYRMRIHQSFLNHPPISFNLLVAQRSHPQTSLRHTLNRQEAVELARL